jgi:hypothetical protein
MLWAGDDLVAGEDNLRGLHEKSALLCFLQICFGDLGSGLAGGLFLAGEFHRWSVLREALDSHKQGRAHGYGALEWKVVQGRRRSGGSGKAKDG